MTEERGNGTGRRRTLLGAVIGTVAGGDWAGGPFRAAEAVPVATLGQTLGQRLIRLHGLGPSMRRKFRATFVCVLGGEARLIWAPGLLGVEGWTWTFHGLTALRPFRVGETRLVDDQGYVLGRCAFDDPRPVEPGNVLEMMHTLIPPDVHCLRAGDLARFNDRTISSPCERLIVARHLGQPGADAWAAPGRIDGEGRGFPH
jgi:hypothetical protein